MRFSKTRVMIAAVAVAGAIGLLGGGSAAAAPTVAESDGTISASVLPGSILLRPDKRSAIMTVRYSCSLPEVSIEVRIVPQYTYVIGNTILAHLRCGYGTHDVPAIVPVSRAYPSGTFAMGPASVMVHGTNCYDLKVLPAGGCHEFTSFENVTLTGTSWLF